MTRLLTLIVLLALTAPAHAEWRQQDTINQTVYTAVNVANLVNTWNVTDPHGPEEVNPIIGKHPTRTRLVSTFLVTAAAHYLLARALPAEWRDSYYSLTIGIKVAMVDHDQNYGDRRYDGWNVMAHFRY